ncbi:MAG: hypothetical protein K8I29_00530 [Alphaproteobacteria bacterium]|uniref:Uncharacterized protein n=1 Tax=Candidatus Nitrobium versatile TaxID=2884831 RepID=A0A953LYS8_9BACT|nr:hypothetical protein [Candidatus Nitrobium versatile]
MVEYLSDTIHPAPGQLWKNVRTGTVLFIYRRDGHVEGISGEGRKKRGGELVKMEHGKNGWKCLCLPDTEEGLEKTDSPTYEFRAL